MPPRKDGDKYTAVTMWLGVGKDEHTDECSVESDGYLWGLQMQRAECTVVKTYFIQLGTLTPPHAQQCPLMDATIHGHSILGMSIPLPPGDSRHAHSERPVALESSFSRQGQSRAARSLCCREQSTRFRDWLGLARIAICFYGNIF